MERVNIEQRRRSVAARHHLAPWARSSELLDIVEDLVALHATDPATVVLSAWARVDGLAVDALADAQYESRALIRMMGMRRTVFVFPADLAGVVHQACLPKIAAANRKRLVALLEQNGVERAGAWLDAVGADVLAVLDERGEALAAELAEAVPALATRITQHEDKAYGGEGAVNNQVLTLLAMEGKIARGRPRGSSPFANQYRWAPVGRWSTSPLDALDPGRAEAELARRWLRTFGPAPASDLQWWAGWTVTQTKRALAATDAVEIEVEVAEGEFEAGHVLPETMAVLDQSSASPWVALLPALDPTSMGWKHRDWYLGPHRDHLFDRSGNIGPTIWADGRVVGAWAQRADGEIVTQLLEDLGADQRSAVAARAQELRAWLGPLRFKPRFPTPLERTLRS